jgi:hypothetical protein
MPKDTSNGDRYARGSKPPFLPLSEAFSISQQIFEQGGGQASFDLLSKITGNSSSSSSFVKKVNALKTFGLVTEPDKGKLELSDLGLTVVAPRTPEEAASAKMQSFLRPEVFNRIYERHKGKLLPADEFIKNIVEQDCGKPRELSQEWVAAFKEAAKTVGILHERGDGKTQIMESPILRFPRSIPEQVSQSEGTVVLPTKQPQEDGSFAPLAASGHLTKIEVSGGRYAAFTVPDRLTKRDAQKLKGALAGLSQIIDSMIDESEGSD